MIETFCCFALYLCTFVIAAAGSSALTAGPEAVHERSGLATPVSLGSDARTARALWKVITKRYSIHCKG